MNENFKQQLVAIAREASGAILTVYKDIKIDFQIKGDHSPVTAADLQSQRIIIEELKKISPYPVLGEENPIAYDLRKEWSDFWLVDPLDGTKDFIAKNDEFTINIALIKEGQPLVGLVALPAKDLYYFAAKGQGAFRISDKGEEQISNIRTQKDLICLDSRFHSSPETAAFCENNGISQIERFGSALKFCRLAEGVADIYPRLAPTKEWDIAAGHCILQEAGCQIIDLKTGQAPCYNKPSLLNNHFIALRSGLSLNLDNLKIVLE